jgi:hypothetical protein
VRLKERKVTAGLGILMLSLIACDSQYSSHNPIVDEVLRDKIAQQVEGQKLRQIASEVVLPVRSRVSNGKVPEQARPYVGRYKFAMRCEDPFVDCEQGTAEFIISLLEDGTAHRSIIYLGTIQSASEDQYRQDVWSYNPNTHQIILHRASGVEFFYDIDRDGNIVMDLNKIANATAINRDYFAKGNRFPTQAYKLLKIE